MSSRTILLSGITMLLYLVEANWTIVTSPPIPNIDYKRVIGYDYKNDLVWLLGGINNRNQLISFNPLTITYTNHGPTLSRDIFSESQSSYTQIQNILYITMRNFLYKYDFDDTGLDVQIVSNAFLSFNSGHEGCLSSIDSYLIFTVYSYPTTKMYIYNIMTNTWTNPPNTPSSIVNDRYLSSCQISNAGYLYLIGGCCSSNKIEKLFVGDILNINDYNWTVLTSTISVARDTAPSVIFNDLIYYIGGYSDSPGPGYTNSVDVIDTTTDVISLIDSLFEPISNIAAVMISNTIYAFGGQTVAYYPRTYYQYYVTDAEPTTTSEPITTSETTTSEPITTSETTTSEPITTSETTTSETTTECFIGSKCKKLSDCCPNNIDEKLFGIQCKARKNNNNKRKNKKHKKGKKKFCCIDKGFSCVMHNECCSDKKGKDQICLNGICQKNAKKKDSLSESNDNALVSDKQNVGSAKSESDQPVNTNTVYAVIGTLVILILLVFVLFCIWIKRIVRKESKSKMETKNQSQHVDELEFIVRTT